MRRIAAVVLGLFLSLSFPVGAEQAESLLHAGVTRTYRLHVPPAPVPGKPLPLLLVFHGRATNGWMTSFLTKFSPLADKERFIVVYPDGLYHNWNDGRGAEVSRSHLEKVDDEGFIKALITHLATRYPIDFKRIYAAGISNGALFTHYFSGRNPDLVAAIACVAGGLPQPFDRAFEPKYPVAALLINGTDDPIVPFHGGAISPGARGSVLSTVETLRRWIAMNKCASETRPFEIPDRDRSDGCTAVGFQWGHGDFASEVIFVKVMGGGHTWPGAIQYLPKIFIGRICRDFSATKMIWDFCKRHAKPD